MRISLLFLSLRIKQQPMESHPLSIYKVFTPSTLAIANFVERRNHFSNDLVDAINQPGIQIVLYGHSGAGKSTLCTNKINQLKSQDPIITRCTSKTTCEEIILDAFDQLNRFYVDTISNEINSKIASSFGSEYLLIKSQINTELNETKSSGHKRILPIQLTAQRLAKFLGEAKCLWIIEDFHKVSSDNKTKLSEHLKVFVDSSVSYPELKIIVIGAVDTARQVIEYDPELRNRVTEISVPLMNEEELKEIIENGEKLLNIKFSENDKKKIVSLSSGLAAICHQLCLNMCLECHISETQSETISIPDHVLEKAVTKYVNQSSDSLKKRYDSAIKVQRSRKYENGKEIIHALARLNREECTRADILREIQKVNPEYTQGNLGDYLEKLQTEEYGGVIYYNLNNGRYSFSDPFIQTFIKCKVESEKRSRKKSTPSDFDRLFLKALAERLGLKHYE